MSCKTCNYCKGGYEHLCEIAAFFGVGVAEMLAEEHIERTGPVRSALDTQEGGNHYKTLAIQPVEYVHANGIGYFEGNVIKYVSRWRNKNGIADLRKAIHFIELLIELEEKRAHSQKTQGDNSQAA